MEKAEEWTVQGRRCELIGDTEGAVDAFEMALQVVAEECGEVDIRCAPYYLQYGKAMLDLHKKDSDIFGSAVKEAALEKGATQVAALQEEVGLDKEEEEEEEEAPKKIAPPPLVAEALQQAMEKQLPGLTSALDSAMEGVQGEEDNLEIAWEALEMARLLFEKHVGEDKKAKERLADTRLLLGDVNLENDNMDAALDDYKSCIELRESVMKPSDRRVASAHFTMAAALIGNSMRKAAEQHFIRAASSLKLRVEELKGTQSAELKNISSLLEDVQERIVDCQKEDAPVNVKESMGTTSIGFGAGSMEDDVLPVRTLSPRKAQVKRHSVDEKEAVVSPKRTKGKE